MPVAHDARVGAVTRRRCARNISAMPRFYARALHRAATVDRGGGRDGGVSFPRGAVLVRARVCLSSFRTADGDPPQPRRRARVGRRAHAAAAIEHVPGAVRAHLRRAARLRARHHRRQPGAVPARRRSFTAIAPVRWSRRSSCALAATIASCWRTSSSTSSSRSKASTCARRRPGAAPGRLAAARSKRGGPDWRGCRCWRSRRRRAPPGRRCGPARGDGYGDAVHVTEVFPLTRLSRLSVTLPPTLVCPAFTHVTPIVA